jgi:hypothetical protein
MPPVIAWADRFSGRGEFPEWKFAIDLDTDEKLHGFCLACGVGILPHRRERAYCVEHSIPSVRAIHEYDRAFDGEHCEHVGDWFMSWAYG